MLVRWSMKLFNTATLVFLVACGSDAPSRSDCNEGKCDTPDDLSVKKQCDNSRTSAMDERRPHFTSSGVRWSCRDVNGVTADDDTTDDRGQEYCEYFSLLHTAGIPAVISNADGPVFCDASTPCKTGVCDTTILSCVTAAKVDSSHPAAVLGKNLDEGNTVSALDPKLSAGQVEWLTQNPTQKVGECVFTSWHHDVTRPLTGTATLAGFELGAKAPTTRQPLFRMAQSVNSNGAAQTLVEDCLIPGKKKIADGFDRGCSNCGSLNGGCVPFRKSDPSVCTMAMRIAECGCTIDIKTTTKKGSRRLDLTKPSDLDLAKELFVPESRRGFTLGSWDGIDRLPNGCRYIETGDPKTVSVNGVEVPDAFAPHTLVACDLLASHVSSAAKDPKEACRQVYGEDVVVHVRAPSPNQATLTCNAKKSHCAGVPWAFANLKI